MLGRAFYDGNSISVVSCLQFFLLASSENVALSKGLEGPQFVGSSRAIRC